MSNNKTAKICLISGPKMPAKKAYGPKTSEQTEIYKLISYFDHAVHAMRVDHTWNNTQNKWPRVAELFQDRHGKVEILPQTAFSVSHISAKLRVKYFHIKTSVVINNSNLWCFRVFGHPYLQILHLIFDKTTILQHI